MNLIEKLTNAGLTKQEAKVYIALLELGGAKSGKLCGYANITSSNIYGILDNLKKKGLVSYTTKNNIKIFRPSPAERLNDLLVQKQEKLEEERKELTSIISNLKTIHSLNQDSDNYRYFEKLGGVISMWREITAQMSSGSSAFIFASKVEGYKKMVPYYDEFHKERVKKKVQAKIILPLSEKELGKIRKGQKAEVRYFKLENMAEFGVVDDMVYVQYVLDKEPRGFLIKDKIIASSLIFMLENFWSLAKE